MYRNAIVITPQISFTLFSFFPLLRKNTSEDWEPRLQGFLEMYSHQKSPTLKLLVLNSSLYNTCVFTHGLCQLNQDGFFFLLRYMTLIDPLNLLVLHRPGFVYLSLSDLFLIFLLLLSTDTNVANSTNETEIGHSLSILLPSKHLESS